MAGSASQEEPEPAQKRQKVKSEGHGEESSAPAASQPSNPPDAGQAHAGIGEFAPLLAAAASTNAAERTRRIAALLELERRSSLLRDIKIAEQVCAVLRVQVRDPSDVYAACLTVAAMEGLVCSPLLQGPSSLGEDVIQELIESVSAPRVPPRFMERCLLALFRAGEACPSLPRHGLSAIISLSLREGQARSRRLGLKLLAQSKISPNGQDGRSVCIAFFKDADHLVRTAALNAVQSYRPIPLTLLSEAVACLSDDVAGVRRESLRLIAKIAVDAQPNATSPLTSSSKTTKAKATDECFMQICSAFFDVDRYVRTTACLMLGAVPAVTPHYLVQTLTKRLLTSEQLEEVEQSALEGDGDLHINPQSHLLSADAAGAFVVGLEDEFWQVRKAAIKSICQLALRSRVFREKSLEVIVDMLSDEIETVRLAAVRALYRIRNHIHLSSTHLQVVLKLLQDVSQHLRVPVQALLASVPLTDPASLKLTIQALKDNIKMYPQDTPNIYCSLNRLGVNLHALAEQVTLQMLTVDTPYLTTEPDVDDTSYVATMVFVLSAASVNPHVLSLCPSHSLRHWRYLREKEPDVIPWIEVYPVHYQMLEFSDAGTVAVKETDAEASLLLGRVRDLIVEARDTGASKANGAEALGAGVAAVRMSRVMEKLGEAEAWVGQAGGRWEGGGRRGELGFWKLYVRVVRDWMELRGLVRGQGRRGREHRGGGKRGAEEIVACIASKCASIRHGFCGLDAASRQSSLECTAAALAALLVRGEQDGAVLKGGIQGAAEKKRLVEAALRAVDGYWPGLPEPQRSGVQELEARITHPPASENNTPPLEFDCRLPLKFQLHISLTGMTSVVDHGLAVEATFPDGSWQLLHVYVVDVVLPNDSSRLAELEDDEEEDDEDSWVEEAAAVNANGANTADSKNEGNAAGAAVSQVSLVRGWLQIEISEPWSRPGYVRMRMVKVVSRDESQIMFAAGAQGLVVLGPPRRYLIHPVLK